MPLPGLLVGHLPSAWDDGAGLRVWAFGGAFDPSGPPKYQRMLLEHRPKHKSSLHVWLVISDTLVFAIVIEIERGGA